MTAHKELRRAQKAVPRACGAWGLFRDGDLWRAFLSRELANREMLLVQPGSKHEWRVCRVWVEPKL